MTDHSHRPRKRFGQNFLQDESVIERIVNLITRSASLPLIEIGPGRGALTLPLLRQLGELSVIELDKDLVGPLAERCQTVGEIAILQQDVLTLDFNRFHKAKLHVVGNLPYNISTPLLFHLLQYDCVRQMTFMLQKEVVDRLCAAPGSSDYSRLSVMAQFYCQLQKEFDVPASAFYPAPKVTSSVVSLQRHAELPLGIAPELFSQLVKQAFSQRRKMLRNNLKSLISEQELETLGIQPTARPQELSLADYLELTQHLQQSSTEKTCG